MVRRHLEVIRTEPVLADPDRPLGQIEGLRLAGTAAPPEGFVQDIDRRRDPDRVRFAGMRSFSGNGSFCAGQA